MCPFRKAVATGIKVYGRVSGFGPGVHRKVGFFDDDHPADTLWRKLVKHRLNNGGARFGRRPFQKGLNPLNVIQDGFLTTVVFDKQMATLSIQFFPSPPRRNDGETAAIISNANSGALFSSLDIATAILPRYLRGRGFTAEDRR